MSFYSIIFESEEQERRFYAHPWMRYLNKAMKQKYLVIGNRYSLAPSGAAVNHQKVPVYLSDLNLDQILESILTNNADKPLHELFIGMCAEESLVAYRQEIMRDLEQEEVLLAFTDLHQGLETALRLKELSKQVHYPAQKELYVLDSMKQYRVSLQDFAHRSQTLPLRSRGLRQFGEQVCGYLGSTDYLRFSGNVQSVAQQLTEIGFQAMIGGGRVEMRFAEDTANYTEMLLADLDCARLGAAQPPEYREISFFKQLEMCPLENRIMDIVQKQYGQAFHALHQLVEDTAEFMHPDVVRFASEVRFYLRYIDFMRKLQSKGFSFVYPTITNDGTAHIEGLYDMALADKAENAGQVVANDLTLQDGEIGIVITGANQGGKTTYARSFGQAAAFAALGLPVAAQKASLPLFSKIFTQFSEREDSNTDDGKLKNELNRLKPILDMANNGSLVILNELFSSTTAWDALEMGRQVVSRLTAAGATVACVTHIPELADGCPGMVSMVAKVRESDGKRTYIIQRAPADGLAHAADLAVQYHLTYGDIKERILHGI